jgi:hypothetical protein
MSVSPLGELLTPRGLSPRNELYLLRDRRLSAKLVPTYADRKWHVVSVTNPYGSILGFSSAAGRKR